MCNVYVCGRARVRIINKSKLNRDWRRRCSIVRLDYIFLRWWHHSKDISHLIEQQHIYVRGNINSSLCVCTHIHFVATNCFCCCRRRSCWLLFCLSAVFSFFFFSIFACCLLSLLIAICEWVYKIKLVGLEILNLLYKLN